MANEVSDEEIRIAINALANTKDAIKNIQALEKSLNITTSAADRMKMATTGAISPKLAEEAKKSEQSLNDMDESGKKVNKTFSSMINVVKGAVTAMLTLAVIRQVTQFFSDAMKSAQDFRAQLVQLNFAEAILSKNGMDITRKELDNFITDIESRYKYLSKLDATKIVSETSGAVQEFNVSKKQLGELSDAIAFIQLKNQMLGKEEADAAHIINAAMDARSNFFNGMGINITETIVKEKAYKMGLAEVGDELTKQQRFQAILALLTEQTSSKQAELNKQLEGTALGNQLKFQKEYKDTIMQVGTQLLSVKDKFLELFSVLSSGGQVGTGVVQVFADLATEINNTVSTLETAVEAVRTIQGAFGDSKDAGERWLQWILDAINPLEIVISALQTLGALLATLIILPVTFWANLLSGKGVGTAIKEAGLQAGQTFVDGMSIAIETLLGDENGRIASWIKDQWKKITGVDINALHTPKVNPPTNPTNSPDTPTGPSMSEGIDEEAAKTKKAVEKMHDDVLDAYKKMQQDIEDANTDFNRKMADITTEYSNKRLDEQQNYGNKVSDINRDSNRRLQDLAIKRSENEAKARADSLKKEQEYQNKLLEMREEFLMNLDDALHARDARQILKLIKNYNLEKTQAERKHELDKQAEAMETKLRQQSYENERKDIEADRKRKLEDASIDHQRKLQQLAEEEARERAQAKLALDRKQADIQLSLNRRLQAIGAGLVAELNLTAQGLAAVVALYTQAYGPGGAIDQLYQGMLARLQSQKPQSSQVLAPGANPSDPQSQAGGYGHDHSGGYNFGFAEGGSLLVNKPTSVLMGEGGVPEVATFTPIGKQGTDMNKLFTNLSGGSSGVSAGGAIELSLNLSPDLEARITKNTLKQTADVILRVNRSK